MTKTQLDNIIMFCLNFHFEMGNFWNDNSPDYILEKWDKYIGTKPIKNHTNNLRFKKEFNDWVCKWHVSNKDYDEFRDIILFLSILNNKLVFFELENHWDVSKLLKEFSKFADTEKVSDVLYNNLHPIVLEKYKTFIELNIREYNLILLEI